MNDQQPLRQIHNAITRTAFLYVEDALHFINKKTGEASPKLRFFGAKYGPDGMESYVSHYVDLADARVLLDDLAHIQNQPMPFTWFDYKGSPSTNGQYLANTMEVNARVSKDGKGVQVFISLLLAPGTKEGGGVVKPIHGRPPISQVNIRLDVAAARRLAYEVQAYLQAYETCRLWAHMQSVGQTFSPYPLSQRGGQSDLLAEYQYGDGTAVPNHPATQNAFDLFEEEKGRVPKDGAELADWWDERRQAAREREGTV